jgi:thioredoxin reductase (NADPH)
MSKIASRVVLIEAMPGLTAAGVLRDRVKADPKIEVRCGVRVEAIAGKDKVEAIELLEIAAGRRETLKLDGVLVHIGLEPNTGYLEGVVPLDGHGQVIVNGSMETEVPYVLAAGDIRSGSPRQVAAAVGDGAIAGITAERLLEQGG